MDIFDEIVPSGHMLSSFNVEAIDLSGCFPSQMSSFSSICDNPMWSDPSTRVNESEFDQNVLSSNSFPTTTSFGNEWDLPGFDSFYLQGGSFDNQSRASLLCDPSSLQGLEEISSTDFPTCFLQEFQTDDDIMRLISDTGLDSALNDDLLKSLVADLPAMPSHSSVTNLTGGISSYNTAITNGFGMHSDNKNTGAMERVSEVEGSSPTLVPKKGLFSQLGLDHLLSNRAGSSTSARCFDEDQFSAPKRRRMDCSSAIDKGTPFGCDPVNNFTLKAEVSAWTGKSYTADVKSCITEQPERAEEPSKVTKKRARPGESTRPRPKDRQMIQDRLKELRDIIPNSAKCSIDLLLDHTIKHMLFMQGVTKYAEKLKQVDELKARRDDDNCGISGSAAWAIDVGGQNPIIVEDLGESGQMRIEMLCEGQGFFLEIADVIRSFGLTILKGVVEARDEKVWAHFIVEANRNVTRMQVLMSLLHLLQDSSTNPSTLKTIADDNNASSLNNYHDHPMMSIPIGLADPLI